MSTYPLETHVTCKCTSVKYSTKLPYPQCRSKHASCLHENFVYVFGGKDGNISLKDLWRLNIASNKWELVSFRGDMPHHLEGHTLVSSKKLLLMFGGEFGDAHTESSLWIISPDLGYIRKSSLDPGSERPCTRRYHSAVVYNGAMYVYGGYIDMKGSSSELWKYQIDDEEWELVLPRQQGRDVPGSRHGHSAVVFDNHMWVYGGNSDLNARQDLWSYSFGGNRWSRLKLKYGPPSLSGHSATQVGSRMFIFGGETSRETVNHLWCFCFKTDKWSQIVLKDQIPARTFHSAVFIVPSQHDNSVKASSLPYIQKKISKVNLERPKSSPGTRPTSTESRKTLQPSDQYRGVQKGQRPQALDYDPHVIHNCQMTQSSNLGRHLNSHPLHSSESKESLKMLPSPAENVADKSPLCPKKTDINYNALNFVDRNNILHGIDNPGVSDSTEELIRQTRLVKERDGNGELIETGHKVLAYFRTVSCSDENPDQLIRHPLRPNSVPRDPNLVMELNVSDSKPLGFLQPKKSRLDLELVLEDIEHMDCFPQDVKLSYPSGSFAGSGCSSSVENMVLDFDDIETLELKDQPNSRSKSAHSLSGTSVGLKSGRSMDAVYFDSGKESVCIHSDKIWNTNSHDTENVDRLAMGKDKVWQECVNGLVSDCSETAFATENIYQQNENMYRKKQSVNTSKMSKILKQSDQPYILVLGGKDHRTVHFGIKPMPLWKLQTSPL